MEQFFVGLLFGVIFSAAFFLLAVLNRKVAGNSKRLSIWLVAELFVVAIVLLVMHWNWDSLSGSWGKSHQWFQDYLRRPMHWFQFILGVLSGGLLRFWVVRIGATYPLTQLDRPRPLWPVEQAAETPKDFLTRERGWIFSLIGLLLVAVLIPQLEGLVRSMTSLKVVGIEVSFREQKESNRATLRPFDREKTIVAQLSVTSPELVATRLASDERSYPRISKPTYKVANAAYLKLFDTVIAPYYNCMARHIDHGHEFETIRKWTREIVVPWQRLASRAKRLPVEIIADYDNLVSAAQEAMKQARCGTSAKLVPAKSVKKAGASNDAKGEAKTGSAATADEKIAVTGTPEFYHRLAVLLHFLDNRLAAIQMLEANRDRFAGDMNWNYFLATLYYEEDSTLEKALEHYDVALDIAKSLHAAAEEERRKSSVICQASKPSPGREQTEAEKLCEDQQRFKGAINDFSNGVAYVLAQTGGASRLARAIQLAKVVVQVTRPTGTVSPADRESYLSNLDTLAFAILAAEAGSAMPDGEAIACATSAFRYMAEEWRTTLRATLQKAGEPGFRREYLSVRYSHEAASQHLTAASLLQSTLERGGQIAARCPGGQLQKLMEGNY